MKAEKHTTEKRFLRSAISLRFALLKTIAISQEGMKLASIAVAVNRTDKNVFLIHGQNINISGFVFVVAYVLCGAI